MRAAGNFDIAVITNYRQQFLRQNFMAQRRVIRPVITIRCLCGVDVPLRRVVTFFHNLIHQLQGAGDNSSPGFLRVEEFMLIDLFCLGVVTNIDHFHVLIGSAQKQIEQNIKAFGHVFRRLIHGSGDVHQAEHHSLAGRIGTLLVIFVAQVEGVDKRHAFDFGPQLSNLFA